MPLLKARFVVNEDVTIWWHPMGLPSFQECMIAEGVDWFREDREHDVLFVDSTHPDYPNIKFHTPTLIFSHRDVSTPNLESRKRCLEPHVKGIVLPTSWNERWRHNVWAIDCHMATLADPLLRTFQPDPSLPDSVPLYTLNSLPWSVYHANPWYRLFASNPPVENRSFNTCFLGTYDYETLTYATLHRRQAISAAIRLDNHGYSSFIRTVAPRFPSVLAMAVMHDAKTSMQPWGHSVISSRNYDAIVSYCPLIWPMCPSVDLGYPCDVFELGSTVRCRPDWTDLQDAIDKASAISTGILHEACRVFVSTVSSFKPLACRLKHVLEQAAG